MHSSPRFFVASLCFILPGLLLFLTGCNGGGPPTSETNASPRILATTTMVGDLVRHLAGKETTVTVLMGPGVDPHLYKPTASDITALQKADLVFYSGLHLEGRIEDLMHRMKESGKTVHAVTENLADSDLMGAEDGAVDPHVWGDASLWARCIPVVADALVKSLPNNAEAIRERAAALEEELANLHTWAKEKIAQIPAERRVLITSHDAFGYFGRAYDLEVIGVQGLSTATEAGLADITKVGDIIRNRGIRAVFVETSVAPGTIERISTDTGADIGGELYSDALGTPGDMETFAGDTYDKGTYTGMLKHNVNKVVEALSK